MAMKKQNLADNKLVPPLSRGSVLIAVVPREAVNRAPLWTPPGGISFVIKKSTAERPTGVNKKPHSSL